MFVFKQVVTEFLKTFARVHLSGDTLMIGKLQVCIRWHCAALGIVPTHGMDTSTFGVEPRVNFGLVQIL